MTVKTTKIARQRTVAGHLVGCINCTSHMGLAPHALYTQLDSGVHGRLTVAQLSSGSTGGAGVALGSISQIAPGQT